MTRLSPPAQALWDAFNEDEVGVFVDYGDKLAAAIEALTAYCHVTEIRVADGVIEFDQVITCDQLLSIARELKGYDN
jgi:hypothetical protein